MDRSAADRSPPGGATFGPAMVPLLGAAVLLLAALYLLPLSGFAYFGSDTGEYDRLVTVLVASGHLPVGGSYGGWGVGYPDFPGLFVVAGAAAGATGADPLTALIGVVPILSAFAVAPLFLLFRRVVPHDGVALLGAGFAGVFMPRAFALAHPAPLALGDLLVVGALWMFLEGRTDLRWYVPLVLTATAMIVTHHLSSYFFLVLAAGGLLGIELLRPGTWSARFPARELAFLAAFALGMLGFWFLAAPDFTGVVIAPSHLLGLPTAALEALLAAGAVVGPLVLAGAIRWRRASRRRPLRASFPSDRSVVRDMAILGVALVGSLATLLLVPLPGTQQGTTASALLYFAPILIAVPLVAGCRRLLTLPRAGPLVLAWTLVLGVSAVVALAAASPVVPAIRHSEYLVVPLGAMLAISLGRWVARAGDAGGRGAGAAVLAGAVLLLAANAAIVYPPPSDLGGFQEGLTPRDALLAEWASGGLPAGTVVATDHRLSSYLFGIDGDRATWGSTYPLFCGSDRAGAASNLVGSPAPTQYRPVQAVAVDGVMASAGVALDPGATAVPISPEAAAWLAAPPFVPIYEDAGESVAWVAGPLLPAP